MNQFLCMDMKTQQSSLATSNSVCFKMLFLRYISMVIFSSFFKFQLLTTATVSHHPLSDLNKASISRSNSTSLTNINRYISTPTFDQFSSSFQHQHHRFEEDQPLRIHVGNIPFLWTIDDLCKQFLVRRFFLFDRE